MRTGSTPTGVVTFAFTDIEGSTSRWERNREAMQEAVRRHDAIVRSAVAACDGHVFKTIGEIRRQLLGPDHPFTIATRQALDALEGNTP